MVSVSKFHPTQLIFSQVFNPPQPAPLDANTKPIKFGCLGAARILSDGLIIPTKSLPAAQPYAIAARSPQRAEAFAKKYGFKKHYGGANAYDELLNDPEVDAVYNPLPNGLHFEWTMKALRKGKHVLLEKPITNTAEEARIIFEEAEKRGLVVLEAFHYRWVIFFV